MRERKRARRPARRPYESSPHATQLTTDLLLLPHPSLWPRDRESGRGVAPDSGHHCPEAWAACRSGKPCVWYRSIRMQESRRNDRLAGARGIRGPVAFPGRPSLPRRYRRKPRSPTRFLGDCSPGFMGWPVDRQAAPTDTSHVVVNDDSGTSFEPSGGFVAGLRLNSLWDGSRPGSNGPREGSSHWGFRKPRVQRSRPRFGTPSVRRLRFRGFSPVVRGEPVAGFGRWCPRPVRKRPG
jgi:hypothetical protein